MGYVEIEEFALVTGADEAAFVARDAALQRWSYVHRPNLLRRTTALSTGGRALVVTQFSGEREPEPPAPGAPAVAALAELIEPASYRRACYRDLG